MLLGTCYAPRRMHTTVVAHGGAVASLAGARGTGKPLRAGAGPPARAYTQLRRCQPLALASAIYYSKLYVDIDGALGSAGGEGKGHLWVSGSPYVAPWRGKLGG